ncbi:hypothetical protein PM082_023556 [Marasmius tenuissimus]|nr:hypothetical protein PM082_023556 [Marasmius tenuissimus]
MSDVRRSTLTTTPTSLSPPPLVAKLCDSEMSRFFNRARHTNFYGDTHFQHVAGNVTTHVHNYSDGRYVGDFREHGTVIACREIPRGDVILRKGPFRSEDSMTLFRDNNPFRKGEIDIISTVYTAEVVQFQERVFTVVSLEATDKRDKEAAWLIWEEIHEMLSSLDTGLGSPGLTQLFGVVKSENALGFIMHDELLNGDNLMDQYFSDTECQDGSIKIIPLYLQHTLDAAVEKLRADRLLAVPVTSDPKNWMFSLTTSAWQYNVLSVASGGRSKFSCGYTTQFLDSLQLSPPIAHQQPVTGPHLDVGKIVAFVEQNFGNVSYLLVSRSLNIRIEEKDLSSYDGRPGFWGLGTVVRNLYTHKEEVVAHHRSESLPEWRCTSITSGVNVRYSDSAPSRVDISYPDTSSHSTYCDPRGVVLRVLFTWCLPFNERNRFRAGYLTQFPYMFNDPGDCAYLDAIGFFLYNQTPIPLANLRCLSAYLFVPPLPIEWIDNTCCIRRPFPSPIFYWTSDPEGQHVIQERDWKKHNIPELQVSLPQGSRWEPWAYKTIKRHMRMKGYDLYWKRYARDRGYPDLILGSPFDMRLKEPLFEVAEDVDTPSHSDSRPAFPPTLLLAETPTPRFENESGGTLTEALEEGGWTSLMRGFFKKYYDSPSPGKHAESSEQQKEDLDDWPMICL